VRPLRIRQKLLVVSLLPAALAATLIGLYGIVTRVLELEEALESKGQAIANQLAPAAEYGVYSGNLVALRRLVEAAAREPDVRSVTVTDAAGWSTARPSRARRCRWKALRSRATSRRTPRAAPTCSAGRWSSSAPTSCWRARSRSWRAASS